MRNSIATPVADAPTLVDRMIEAAVRSRASDLHLDPTAKGYDLRLRIDGLLQNGFAFPPDVGRSMVSRLMVMGHLLTYRIDIPQEGRISFARPDDQTPPIELRLAIMPTTHGLRAAVRLPADHVQARDLSSLGLPKAVVDVLTRFASADAGMLVVTGPAGSGKTTTLHTLLRHIVENHPGQSIVALEDPVERDLPGVTQIEVTPFGEMTYERALRSILRQDPQVLMLGEIRDAATASLAVQAALSGHRLICTLHAGTCGGAIARLLEMGIEPYQLTSTIHAVVAQRLLRRKSADGYQGRVPAAEVAVVDENLRVAILARKDAASLQTLIESTARHESLQGSALQLEKDGVTDEAERMRVFGSARTTGS